MIRGTRAPTSPITGLKLPYLTLKVENETFQLRVRGPIGFVKYSNSPLKEARGDEGRTESGGLERMR